jgi:hypothetical protein
MEFFKLIEDKEKNIGIRSLRAESEQIKIIKVGIDLLLESGATISNQETPISGNVSEDNSKNFFAVRFLATIPIMVHWCLKSTLAGNYTMASTFLRPLLESQISMSYYLEFPNQAHQLMLSNFVESGGKKGNFIDPRPRSKMKQMKMKQNHIVYKNWEDFNRLTAHPVAMVPSLFVDTDNGGIAVEPFFSQSGLSILLNHLDKSIRFTFATLLKNYAYLADPTSEWYAKLQDTYKMSLDDKEVKS